MNGFAAAQLKKFGWQEGKGLGKLENGVTEPIKPKLKFNTGGLAYDPGEEFKFHWWDHVFNKAAKNIDVETQNGTVELSRKEELRVSKKLESATTTNTLYHGFLKGGILNKGKMDSDDSDSDSDSDAENTREKDMSRTLTDEELFKLCGGRTAHKGARHGLNMSAKLARVQEQERKLMEGWKKSDEKSWEPKREDTISLDLLQGDLPSQMSDERGGKKKNKKRKEKDIEDVNEMTVERTKKKKKKRENEEQSADDICLDIQHSKKKKRKALKECSSEDSIHEEENKKAEEMEDENDDSGKAKKKKKKKKNKEIYEEQITSNSFDEQSSKKKKKKKKSFIETVREEESICNEYDENKIEKRKKKKKRKYAEEQENDVE